jgi:HPr kinase/phosphorylase
MALTVEKIMKDRNLEILAGHDGIKNEVNVAMISRPGVEIAGFLDFFEPERLILIGSKENSFLNLLDVKVQKERLEPIFKLQPPAFIFSVNVVISDIFIELGNKYQVPILKSDLRTTVLSSQLYSYLHSKLAPRKSLHGVLLDIHGLGTLIVGKSGIGKSETALELIKRGHILISDDRVDVFEAAPGVVIGSAPKILERFIEIRGIGIVDVVQMFGAACYRENKKIRLIVELELWQENKVYDRLGIETEKVKIFDTEIHKLTIPVLPGRNVATLVESAALNQKLKYLGYDAAKVLTENVAKAASGLELYEDD